jgi:hypothetical protein
MPRQPVPGEGSLTGTVPSMRPGVSAETRQPRNERDQVQRFHNGQQLLNVITGEY